MHIHVNRDLQSSGTQTHYKCFKGIIQDKTPAKKENKTFAAFLKKL